MLGLKILLLIILYLSPLFVESVFACQCSGLQPIQEELSNSKAVFTGKITDLKIDKGRVYTFQIIESFKGVSTQKIEVNNSFPGDMCESGFTVGESYLIYADGKDEKSLYTYNFCSLNDSLNSAQGQIAFLKEFSQGKPIPQIYGSVFRSDIDFVENERIQTPLENIEIIIESKDKKFSVLTDKNGLFRFNKIPKGIYKVRKAVPKKYREYDGFPPISDILVLDSGKVINVGEFVTPSESDFESGNFYLDGKRAYEGEFLDFKVGWNNDLELRIGDTQGNLIKDTKPQLIPINSKLKEVKESHFYQSSNDSYLARSLPPGRYYLVAEVDAPFKNKRKLSVYYPQAESAEKSVILDIKEDDHLKLNMTLPILNSKLNGKVYWEDGTPIVGNVEVYLTNSENFDEQDSKMKIYDQTRLDGASSFSLDGYVDAEYWIHVLIGAESYQGEVLRTKKISVIPVKIVFEKENKPLRILIPKPAN